MGWKDFFEKQNYEKYCANGIQVFIDLLNDNESMIKKDDIFSSINNYVSEGKKFNSFLRDYALYKIFEQCDVNDVNNYVDGLNLSDDQKSRIRATLKKSGSLRFESLNSDEMIKECVEKLGDKLKEVSNDI